MCFEDGPPLCVNVSPSFAQEMFVFPLVALVFFVFERGTVYVKRMYLNCVVV